MKRVFATISALAALTALAAATPAYAATGDFTVYPSYMHNGNSDWIIRDIEQGSTVEEKITAENLTAQPINLALQVRNAYTEDGKFTPDDENITSDLPAWSNLEAEQVTLAPHEKKEIPVKISIPDNAKTGEYAGAILASKAATNDQDIKIVTRIGVRMYLDVTEAKPMMANIFTSPQYSSSLFFILSLVAVLGSLMYNLIHYREQKTYAFKKT